MQWKPLLELYEKLEPLEVIAPPAHTVLWPKIGVLLDAHGNLLAARMLSEAIIIPCTEKSESRTSDICPHPIHDNLSYIGNIPGYERKYDKYIEQLRKYTESVDDELAKSVLSHIKKGVLAAELKPFLENVKTPEKATVVFAMPEMEGTVNKKWESYYLKTLPQNGVCSITRKLAYIPEVYPRDARHKGDFARLFIKTKKECDSMPSLLPGYESSQKIMHTIQFLTAKNRPRPKKIANEG